jgi:hypothetical protein
MSENSSGSGWLEKHVKNMSILGVICGSLYLLAFTRRAGIPFPLDLSVLSTTLLIVGITSLLGTFIVVAGIFLPALVVDDLNKVTNGYFIAQEHTDGRTPVRLYRYFFCIWTPLALALSGFLLGLATFGPEAWKKLLGAILAFLAVSWISFTPRLVKTFEEKRLEYIFCMALQTFAAAFSYFLLILLALEVFPEMNAISAWAGCLVVLVFFTLFHMIITIPVEKVALGRVSLPFGQAFEATPSITAALALSCILTLASVIMPQVNGKIGGSVLRAFNIGGGVPVSICLKSKPNSQMAQRFAFDAENCSQVVAMQLDGGDKVYVSKYISKPKPISSELNQTSEVVYFHQDEIQNKIYSKSMQHSAN